MSLLSKSPSIASDDATVSVDSASNDHKGVGLSNPQLSADRRKMLDLINRLHSTGMQTDIDLPRIVVIGSQSAGKSSLIESISGITLPRAGGTCTRCPTECRLSRSDSPWNDQGGRILGQPRSIVFGGPIFDKSQVEDRIRRAQRAILSPSKPIAAFLAAEEDVGDTEISFSTNYISLQISGPEIADLSFVDLPGLIASVSTRGGNEADIKMVENLVISYISRANSIILLTVACETDFENQGAQHLTKKYDPEGKRTIGVLTKPDRIPNGEEDSWVALVRNERDALENNWYCVKQPSSLDLKDGVTWSSARARETEFFSAQAPWCDVDSVYQPFLGTPNLIQRLSSLLSNLISNRLPQIQADVEAALQQTRASIRQLPKPPSDDAILEITSLVHLFVRSLDQLIDGVSQSDGLIQTIRPAHDTFRLNIWETAPEFRPFDSEAKTNHRWKPIPECLRQEQPDSQISSSDSSRSLLVHQEQANDRAIYATQVLARAESARSRELPGHFPFTVQQAYIKEFTCKWADPAQELCAAVQEIFSIQVKALITIAFSSFGQGSLADRVQVLAQGLIQDQANVAQDAINKQISYEEDGPHTLNAHYLSNYKAKFLRHYTTFRQLESKLTFIRGVLAHEKNNKPVSDDSEMSDNDSSPRSPSAHVSAILKHFSALEVNIDGNDLLLLMSQDSMHPALNIMADVRAYFQVAYKRVVDNVPAAIDHELVRAVGKGMLSTLMKGLGLNGPNATQIALDFARENPVVERKRTELEKKLERLRSASQQLRLL
ncbi:P-loop containing nucleoside triphosphate hydrolase protein [Favolaschia claudopus]|uniref:P-loop containing nucleoside triphosphate hydrolase protein n=1 Tax=Favolaschia claudopus TaxID=2862362 RepID=A0AAV9ZHG4_9AGAR